MCLIRARCSTSGNYRDFNPRLSKLRQALPQKLRCFRRGRIGHKPFEFQPGMAQDRSCQSDRLFRRLHSLPVSS